MPLGDRVVLAQPIWKVSHKEVLAMGPRIERAVQNELFVLGKEARDMARSLAPVDTGALRASIYVTRGVTPNPTARDPYVQQSHNAYFKAANTASEESSRAGSKGRRMARHTRTPRLQLMEPPKVELHTQRPQDGMGFPKASWEKMVGHEGGDTFKTYSKFSGRAGQQSVMEMGESKRSNFWVTLGASAFYAGFVEFGHVNADGGYTMEHPFLRPALEWARQQLPVRMKRAFDRGGQSGVSVSVKG